MKRKLLNILIILAILLGGGYAFLNYYLLPYKAKTLIVEKLSDSLKRDVQIDSLAYSFKDGIVITDIRITSKDSKTEKMLLSSDKVSCNILILPYIFKRKLILTDLNINKPTINIEKISKDTYNFSDILKKDGPKNEKKPTALITSASVTGGNLIYADYSRDDPYKKQISNIDFSYGWLPPSSVKYDLSFSFDDKKPDCQLKGNINLESKEANLRGVLNDISLSELNQAGGYPLKYESFEGQATINLNATLNNKKEINLKSISNLNDLLLKQPSFTIKGASKAEVNVSYNFNKKEIIDISGIISPEGLSVEGLPYVNTFNDIKGRAIFDRQKVVLEDIQGSLLGCPTKLKGVINLKDLYLKLDAKSDLQLEKALAILPKANKEGFKNIKMSGKTYASLNISGSLVKMISLDITGDISLSDVSLRSSTSKLDISSASGKIFLSKDKADIKDINFNFLNKTYNLNASLSDYENPIIDFKILSDDFFSSGNISIDKKNAHINKIQGNYYTHTYELTGEVENLTSPLLNIYGQVLIDTENLDKLLPQNLKNISHLKLMGKIPGDFHFHGRLAEWKNANAGFKANTGRIQLKGLKLNNLYINAGMQNGKATLKNLNFDAYEGIFTMTGDFYLSKPNMPYEANLILKKLNIAKLIEDTKLKGKDIKGTAYLKMQIRNPYKDISGITGSGGMVIVDGYLMQLPVLDTMANLLGISLQEKVVFKEAYADFIIKNQTINSENITLLSEGFEIKSKGSMDFKGNIDFLSNAEFSKEKYEELNASQQVLSMIFNFTNKYITRIRSTGSIGNVKHKLEPASPDEFIFEGLKSLKGIGDLLGL
jgi:hypothetical protein